MSATKANVSLIVLKSSSEHLYTIYNPASHLRACEVDHGLHVEAVEDAYLKHNITTERMSARRHIYCIE